MGSLAVAVVAAALGAPPYYYLIAALIAGLLFTTLIIVFHPPRHLRPAQGEDLLQGSPAASAQLTKSASVTIVSEPLQTWLGQIAEADRAHLASRVVVMRYGWDPSALTVREPYIDFEIGLYNGSVFTIFLTGDVRGHIRCYSNPLATMPDMTQPVVRDRTAGGPRYVHGEAFGIHLRQFISDELRQQILAGRGEQLSFEFEELGVPIGAEDDGSNQRPSLSLGTFTTRLI